MLCHCGCGCLFFLFFFFSATSPCGGFAAQAPTVLCTLISPKWRHHCHLPLSASSTSFASSPGALPAFCTLSRPDIHPARLPSDILCDLPSKSISSSTLDGTAVMEEDGTVVKMLRARTFSSSLVCDSPPELSPTFRPPLVVLAALLSGELKALSVRFLRALGPAASRDSQAPSPSSSAASSVHSALSSPVPRPTAPSLVCSTSASAPAGTSAAMASGRPARLSSSLPPKPTGVPPICRVFQASANAMRNCASSLCWPSTQCRFRSSL
mmetsp:Transcript_55844/g.141424  ORF Transcript_55844/g.141424 Transcript_55844/m.141424 type:complete len:268 (-) Transcript_55844:1148-1951(-)